ncbi:hypothetical protein CL617_01585 [archaeon]|nr:hypothetical protein [archaeon]|tara:strand:- start:13299 stop:13829 length:531 start_codon:yes stop_codon:yes gene_type:complete
MNSNRENLDERIIESMKYHIKRNDINLDFDGKSITDIYGVEHEVILSDEGSHTHVPFINEGRIYLDRNMGHYGYDTYAHSFVGTLQHEVSHNDLSPLTLAIAGFCLYKTMKYHFQDDKKKLVKMLAFVATLPYTFDAAFVETYACLFRDKDWATHDVAKLTKVFVEIGSEFLGKML